MRSGTVRAAVALVVSLGTLVSSAPRPVDVGSDRQLFVDEVLVASKRDVALVMNNDGPIFAELVSSRDGIEWTRQEAPRDPVLPLGQSGSWDDGMVFTVNQPMVEGDRLVLYYGGFDSTHGARRGRSAVGRATLRKDGFASLDAGESAASVTTVPFEGARGALRVNLER